RNSESLTAAVLRTGRPARVNDYAEASGPWAAEARELGYRSGVGVPVTVQGRLWGVMIVTSPEAHHWPRDTEDRLAAFTQPLATAIANTESRGELATSEERARGLAEEQAALRRVATLVAREPASEAFFSAVAREVASVLNVPGALVERFEADGASVSIGAAYDSDLSGAEQFLGVGARTEPEPGSLTAQVFETHGACRRLFDVIGSGRRCCAGGGNRLRPCRPNRGQPRSMGNAGRLLAGRDPASCGNGESPARLHRARSDRDRQPRGARRPGCV